MRQDSPHFNLETLPPPDLNQTGLPEPFYKEMGAGFALVFEKEKRAADFSYKYDKQEKDGKVGEKVGEKEKQILFYISSNAFITYKELAALIGVTEKSIFENIKKLQKKGLLERIGPAKGGYWVVKTVD
jgi:ATP-dependent DNA helicase RecG